MNVSPKRSIARSTPPRAPTLVPIQPRQQRRLRFLDALVEAGCDVIAHGGRALRSLLESREPDAEADRHVIAVRRLAIRGADESAALHECPCWATFRAINEHALEAQRHDQQAVEKLCAIVRGVNRALTRELAKRRPGGGRG